MQAVGEAGELGVLGIVGQAVVDDPDFAAPGADRDLAAGQGLDGAGLEHLALGQVIAQEPVIIVLGGQLVFLLRPAGKVPIAKREREIAQRDRAERMGHIHFKRIHRRERRERGGETASSFRKVTDNSFQTVFQDTNIEIQ